ncbi:MAG TPA: carbohydrate porin [bacterium]|jgi:high affinity Mn2+ porin|nr:carbohydrate porin [bacterium]
MPPVFKAPKLPLAVLCLFLSAPVGLAADTAIAAPSDAWWSAHGQTTAIAQYHPPFYARYSGANSLGDGNQFDPSFTVTLFLGARIMPGLEAYLDPELSAGSGFSGTTGLADFPNGEISKVGSPRPAVKVARAYLQWELGFGGPTETLASAANQVPETRDLSRLTLLAGKFSLSDFFDVNSYAQDARSQFLNTGLIDNGAWDFAADTFGYTDGLYAELNQRAWALRFAEVQEPAVANGAVLDSDLEHAHSENLEAEGRWWAWTHPGKLRFLTFWNRADMGNYRVSLAAPASDGVNIHDSEVPGTLKYGFGLNLEQEITASLGLFSRVGWNNGQTETWAFMEIDQDASVGCQLQGDAWGRPQDHCGLAYVISGLSAPHLEYLAAGGYGFIIGDGALDYAPEQVIETYYSWCPVDGLTLSPDYQFFDHPAYNQARGPVDVFSLRIHYEL